MVLLNCPSCRAPIEIDVAEAVVQNFQTVSQIIVQHPGQTACACGAVFLPAITAIGAITVAAVPVPPEHRKKLVIPATNLPKN